MPVEDSLGPVDPVAEEIIRRWVRPLAGRAGLTAPDLEDLEQVLRVKLLKAPPPPEEDPTRRERLLTTIIARAITNFLRNRRTAKRDYRRVRSLHASIDTPEGRRIELAQTLGEDAHDTRLGCWRRDDQERTELSLDVAELLAALPEDLREVAEHLMHQPAATVARRLGLRPSTLYGLIGRLRRHFCRRGLGDSGERFPSSRAGAG